MSVQATKRHGRTLNTYYHVKEANLKRLYLCHSNHMTFRKRQNYRTVKRAAAAPAEHREQLTIPRPWPKTKSRVWNLTNWATQLLLLILLPPATQTLYTYGKDQQNRSWFALWVFYLYGIFCPFKILNTILAHSDNWKYCLCNLLQLNHASVSA